MSQIILNNHSLNKVLVSIVAVRLFPHGNRAPVICRFANLVSAFFLLGPDVPCLMCPVIL
jgi:hypothetical protein